MGKTFLAFDLGASSGRAIIGKLADGKFELTEVHRFANGPTAKGEAIFWDYPALCNELKTGLQKALAVEKSLDGIAIDTWGVDYVFFDKNTLKPKRWPYHYRDVRTAGLPAKAVFPKISKSELYQKTGIQFMELNTIYQLVAHFERHPEDFKNSFLLTMPDALAFYLGGDPTCEYTECSTTNLLNPSTCQWDWELIKTLGLPKEVFTTIVKPATLGGVLSKELQAELKCGAIPIIKVGSHDTASAVAAVPAVGEGDWAYISAGTWALLGAEIKTPVFANEIFTNEGGVNDTIRYLTNIMGSWLFQETRRVWNEAGEKTSFMEMEQWALAAEPCKFLVNPNDPVFFTPGNMPQNIIDFCKRTGQGEIKTKGEIVRAIYDSLALYFCSKLHDLETILKVKYQFLNIVGGGTKDGLLMQLTSDALNIEVKAGPVEATSIGNLLEQGIAVGAIQSLAEGRKIVKNSFEVKSYRPNAAMYQKYSKIKDRFDQLTCGVSF